MADYDSSPTNQSINYELGFIDNVTKNLDSVQKDFMSASDVMDKMVDKLDNNSEDVGDVSDKFSKSINNIKESVEGPIGDVGLNTENLNMPEPPNMDQVLEYLKRVENLKMPEPPTLKEPPTPARVKSPLEDDKKGGLLDMVKGLGSLTKIVPIIGKLYMMFKTLAPVMELVGFFADMLIMPFEELMFNVAMSLIPIINKLSDVMYQIGDKIIPIIIGAVNSMIPIISKLAEGIGVFLTEYIVPLIGWLADLIGVFSQWDGALPVLAGVLTALLVPAIIMATKAIIGFSIALLANPLTWISIAIAAVVAGIVWMVKHWDKVKESISNVWGSITGFFDGMSDGLKGVLSTAFNIFMPTRWLGMMLDMFGIVESGLLDWMPNWMKWLFGIDEKSVDVKDKTTELANSMQSSLEDSKIPIGLDIDRSNIDNMSEKIPVSIEDNLSRGVSIDDYNKSVNTLSAMPFVSKEASKRVVDAKMSEEGLHVRGDLKPVKVTTVVNGRDEDTRRDITKPIVATLLDLKESVVSAIKNNDSLSVDIGSDIRSLGIYSG